MVPAKRPEAVRVHLTRIVFLIIHNIKIRRHTLSSASLSWAPIQQVLCSLTVRSSEGKIPHSSMGSSRAQKLMKGLILPLPPGRGLPLHGVLGMLSSPLGPMEWMP